jgi:hypothetical protein
MPMTSFAAPWVAKPKPQKEAVTPSEVPGWEGSLEVLSELNRRHNLGYAPNQLELAAEHMLRGTKPTPQQYRDYDLDYYKTDIADPNTWKQLADTANPHIQPQESPLAPGVSPEELRQQALGDWKGYTSEGTQGPNNSGSTVSQSIANLSPENAKLYSRQRESDFLGSLLDKEGGSRLMDAAESRYREGVNEDGTPKTAMYDHFGDFSPNYGQVGTDSFLRGAADADTNVGWLLHNLLTPVQKWANYHTMGNLSEEKPKQRDFGYTEPVRDFLGGLAQNLAKGDTGIGYVGNHTQLSKDVGSLNPNFPAATPEESAKKREGAMSLQQRSETPTSDDYVAMKTGGNNVSWLGKQAMALGNELLDPTIAIPAVGPALKMAKMAGQGWKAAAKAGGKQFLKSLGREAAEESATGLPLTIGLTEESAPNGWQGDLRKLSDPAFRGGPKFEEAKARIQDGKKAREELNQYYQRPRP